MELSFANLSLISSNASNYIVNIPSGNSNGDNSVKFYNCKFEGVVNLYQVYLDISFNNLLKTLSFNLSESLKLVFIGFDLIDLIPV